MVTYNMYEIGKIFKKVYLKLAYLYCGLSIMFVSNVHTKVLLSADCFYDKFKIYMYIYIYIIVLTLIFYFSDLF